MADVVNLRTERKRAKRRDAEQEAAGQRLAHGQPRQLRELDSARREKQDRTLDGHKLTGDLS